MILKYLGHSLQDSLFNIPPPSTSIVCTCSNAVTLSLLLATWTVPQLILRTFWLLPIHHVHQQLFYFM